MTSNIIVIKKDGSQTTRMPQSVTETYLGGLIHDNRVANLKQSLNDVTGARGKATGDYIFNGQPVLHASSGNDVKCVSLFFYDFGGVHYIFAMGEHADSTSYKLSDYGQPNAPYKKNSTISLKKKK
ncbi:MAG: hypothetical protein OEX07_06210 [Gammaproteobacteria bacterium]|nr:hypothetical protein [Gammaproteobacteria bacterium]